MIDEIKNAALKTGSCEKIKNVRTIQGLVNLMFSPQGLEFCKKNDFPSLETMRKVQNEVRAMGVYVDAGVVDLTGERCVCLAGDTQAVVDISGVKHIHTVVLMHGASATINAKDFAVLNIVNISGKYQVRSDNTVVVL